MIKIPVYLDNNATTACDPRVLKVMLPYFTEKFGNAASSTHLYGWEAAGAVDMAREQVADLIGAVPQEIVFTSGATEADNLALKGVYERYISKGNHIITCVTEHKAVLDCCYHLEKMGAAITYLPVDEKGNIDLQQLEGSITPQTILIALMYANNETGVIHPAKAISDIARRHQLLFMCDATQAIGKISVNVEEDGIDLLAMSAHKIYGPKGIGALYVRRKNPRVQLIAQIDGGGHERDRRSGTLNMPGIVGLGKAASLCAAEMLKESGRLKKLRDKLESEIMEFGGIKVNGSTEYRLPHVSNLSFEGLEGQNLLNKLNKKLALSSGSACTSASVEPSFVLKAMGLSDELARASLRFGLGRFTTEEEIEFAVAVIREELLQLRAVVN